MTRLNQTSGAIGATDCRSHFHLPRLARVPMLQGCLSSAKPRLQLSVPSSSGAASYRRRSRATAAVSGHHQHRAGQGIRPHHRGLEADEFAAASSRASAQHPSGGSQPPVSIALRRRTGAADRVVAVSISASPTSGTRHQTTAEHALAARVFPKRPQIPHNRGCLTSETARMSAR
jgi:hypothetical protein